MRSRKWPMSKRAMEQWRIRAEDTSESCIARFVSQGSLLRSFKMTMAWCSDLMGCKLNTSLGAFNNYLQVRCLLNNWSAMGCELFPTPNALPSVYTNADVAPE